MPAWRPPLAPSLPLQDEVLAHRLGLVPLRIEPDFLEVKVGPPAPAPAPARAGWGDTRARRGAVCGVQYVSLDTWAGDVGLAVVAAVWWRGWG